ncbi:hypothetical protein [Halpernia sp.]|uniref:DUF7935 family protein n=1 Tax=Halpernia sp. TaxID=2782209 RepID=UPI003A8D84CE
MNFDAFFPYVFPIIIAIPFLVLLRQFVFTFLKLKNKELQLLSLKSNSENKLQAYERMTLFLERLKPSNLVMKFDKNLKPSEFIFLTEKNIQEEFDYNASQQLYLRQNTWNNIVTSKNNILQLLHKTFEEVHNLQDLKDFKTVFLMKYVEDSDFISETINDLRKDIALLN